MVDVLDLELNVQQMVRAGREASESLKRIEESAKKAGGTLDDYQRGMQVAAARTRETRAGLRAAGEFSQISQAVPRLTQDIQKLGEISGSATQVLAQGFTVAGSAMQTVLFTGQNFVQLGMAAHMAQVADKTGKFAGASSTLALIWRAHPILTIVSLVSAAAVAMGVLASETKKQGDAAEKSARSNADLVRSVQDQRNLFFFDVERGVGGDRVTLIKAEVEAIRDLVSKARSFTDQERRGLLVDDRRLTEAGLPPSLVRRFADRPTALQQIEGAADARLRQHARALEFERTARGAGFPGGGFAGVGSAFLGDAATAAVGRFRDVAGNREILSAQQQETALLRLSTAAREQHRAVIDAENFARQQNITLSDTTRERIREEISAQQQLIEARQFGEQFGDALSLAFDVSAIENWRAAAQNALRAVAAEIQNVLIRAPLRELFGGLSASIFGGASPSTKQAGVQ